MPLLCPKAKGVPKEKAQEYGHLMGTDDVHEVNGGYHPAKSHDEFVKLYFAHLRGLRKAKKTNAPLVNVPCTKEQEAELVKEHIEIKKKHTGIKKKEKEPKK